VLASQKMIERDKILFAMIGPNGFADRAPPRQDVLFRCRACLQLFFPA